MNVGPVFGRLESSGTTTGITFKGQLDRITLGNSVNAYVGGVVGWLRNSSGTNTLFRNLGTFPAGLTGGVVGGVIGQMEGSSLTKVLNAMTGDLFDCGFGGGIAGLLATTAGKEMGEWVNSMTGSISASKTNTHVGGMIGQLIQPAGTNIFSLLNYMRGDVFNTFNTGRAGGLIGTGIIRDFTTSIVAMDGNVTNAITRQVFTSIIYINEAFGLKFGSDNGATTGPVAGLDTDAEIGLPIFDLSATDSDGVTRTFQFLFGNELRVFNQLQIESANQSLNFRQLEIYDLSGENIALGRNSSAGSAFGAATAPLGNNGSLDDIVDVDIVGGVPTWTVDFDREYYLSEINKVIFYNRTGASIVTDRAIGSTISLLSVDGGPPEVIATLTNVDIQEFVITTLPFTTTPRVTTVLFSVTPVDGATGYRLTSQRTGSTREVIALRNFTELSQTIRNLNPDTEYTFRLYSTTGAGFTLKGESSISTLENSAGNYNVNEFVGPSGRFDISTLDSTSVAFISEVMNDLFTTDDAIDIKIAGRTTTSKFVNRGGTVDITNSKALVAPFSTDGGPGQAISMTLSDASSVSVSYDETTEAVTIGTTTYDKGNSLVLDGQKITIVDI